MFDSLTATCVSTHCFCEELSTSGLVQPINSFSSLAFVILGIAGLFIWLRMKSRNMTLESPLIGAFCAVMIFIGLSSFFYHGTLSFVGQFFDIFSMYIFGTLLIMGALVRRGVLSVRRAIGIFIIVNLILGIVQYFYPEARRVLFAAILLPGIILEFLPATVGHKFMLRKMKYLIIGLVSLVVAYVVWILDQNNIICWPSSPVQGHAIWHVLTAVASFMIILHYVRTAHLTKKIKDLG
jgi:hypothetical protein